MGKVQFIKKSRKECKCDKCRQIIPAGSSYYKGEINFGPTIRRCVSCNLYSYEVTTSDYQLQVGDIVYKWREDYETAEDIMSALEDIRDEVQDRLDNMPEQLQDSDSGMLLQERIEALEEVMNELDSIDEESIQEEHLQNLINDIDFEDEDYEGPSEEELEDMDFEEAEEALKDIMPSEWQNMLDDISSELGDAIDEALGGLDV